jgi:hypothetical protein
MKPLVQPSRYSSRLVIIATLLLIMPVWLGARSESFQNHAAAPGSNQTVFLPLVSKDNSSLITLSIQLGIQNTEQGITLDSGGDVDTEVVTAGSPAVQARRTGNGTALPAKDGNSIPDYYMQFKVSDSALYAGLPSPRLLLSVEYLD